ncbi:MAG: extracellular solute-binding protein [Clostridiales bacterium]|jgi:spermidine/putrescine transport system substrate-binding protein|nr:extracellular solute-binding protein [Clostridiales bacterium]
MKKGLLGMLTAVFAAILGFAPLSACAPRENTLRVYNWGEYMDDTVVDKFEDWYKAEYGKKIKVVYKTFEGNEDLHTAVATKKQDWDLICPSDYMMERMIKEDLAQKIDKSVVYGDADPREFMVDGLYDNLTLFDAKNGYATDDYVVPYIWGTFGIMYDTTAGIDPGDVKSWSAIFEGKYSGKIYMKDQERDSYTAALLYARRAALSEATNGFTDYGTEDEPNTAYQNALKEIFTDCTVEKIAEAKAALQAQAPHVYKYESDNGKIAMAEGIDDGKLGLYWSCDAGFAMNDFEVETSNNSCAKPRPVAGNKNLWYTVPQEGSNVWVDGWIIPKYAKNVAGANLFLKFLLGDEISILNSEYAGAPGANRAAMAELKASLEEDGDGYFEGKSAEFKAMYLDMMFPSHETLQRCAVMGDFGDLADEVSLMWSNDIRAGG